jgi:hypothetical protein
MNFGPFLNKEDIIDVIVIVEIRTFNFCWQFYDKFRNPSRNHSTTQWQYPQYLGHSVQLYLPDPLSGQKLRNTLNVIGQNLVCIKHHAWQIAFDKSYYCVNFFQVYYII